MSGDWKKEEAIRCELSIAGDTSQWDINFQLLTIRSPSFSTR